ncbi:hypothetical protein OL229_09085 [Neisseriaceae bacterium JH1-16]|nr:hypothetical protein [Neisseriaceae bacterium JH1-16]
MTLTTEQKQELINKLSTPWGSVHLLCDGSRIDLVVEPCKGLKYRVTTYVNGHWKGEWIDGSKSFPEQKFLNKSTRPLVKKADLEKMEKTAGKRLFKKMCAEDSYWTKTITLYNPSWASGKSAINHLCKVCDSIQVVTEETV